MGIQDNKGKVGSTMQNLMGLSCRWKVKECLLVPELAFAVSLDPLQGYQRVPKAAKPAVLTKNSRKLHKMQTHSCLRTTELGPNKNFWLKILLPLAGPTRRELATTLTKP